MAKNGNGKVEKYLEEDDINKLAAFRAQLRKIRSREEKLTKKLRKLLRLGYHNPESNERMARLGRSWRVGWHDLFVDYIATRRFNGNLKKARKYLDAMDKGEFESSVYTLYIENNPDYEEVKRKKAA